MKASFSPLPPVRLPPPPPTPSTPAAAFIPSFESNFDVEELSTLREHDMLASTTLSIDLSQEWTNDTVVLKTTSKPPGAPELSAPIFAYDEQNDVFYSGFAGRVSEYGDQPDPPPFGLWSFKPDGAGGGTWDRVLSGNDSAVDGLTRPVNGFHAFGGGSALVFGGVATDQTSPETEQTRSNIPLPGNLQLDMAARKLTNHSGNDDSPILAVLGQMHYVPSFGPNGVFVKMGGSSLPRRADNLLDFARLQVYDAATNTWYDQRATGNIPAGRVEFCTAGVESSNETYEIFVYGGHNGNLGPEALPYDEIFILTLPAFHWLKVDYPPSSPRNGHTCNAVGGSQIISVGGVAANSGIYLGFIDEIRDSTFNFSADPFAQGLGIFDMTTLTWRDGYTANAPPYEQSDLVRDFYTTNPQNGSQLDEALGKLFQTTHFTQAAPGASDPSPDPSPTPSSSSKNTGGIAGGVVGGVVGVALIAGLAYFLYRRKRNGYSKPGKGSDTTELRGNDHALQDFNGKHGAGYYAGGDKTDGRQFQELPHEQKPTEVEGTEQRHEMGYDETGQVERRAHEMEATEVGR
ncbi:MAG: hypothetical protein LQ345_004014 [Seirophora villosa]|nr:MAG: hypothetical protein LQ345_004014 [Seirophora villosa]